MHTNHAFWPVEFRVICPDIRGHGLSDVPSAHIDYIPCANGEDMIKLLDTLGIDKVHMVGHSFGTWITSNVVTRNPDRVLSAVFASGAASPESTPEAVEKLVKDTDCSFYCGRACWYPCCGPCCWYCLVGECCAGPIGTHMATRSQMTTTVSADALKAIQVPVLGIVGDQVNP